MDGDYSKVDTKEYVKTLDYLDTEEKEMLGKTLDKFPTLFVGQLNINSIHLKLKPDPKPYHVKPFGIPKAYKISTN